VQVDLSYAGVDGLKATSLVARVRRSPYAGALPCVWTAAAVIALDRVMDIQTLAWPAMGLVVVTVALDAIWHWRRER
jgi:hypothetical protein